MNLLHTNQTNLKQRVRDAGHGWMMLGCVAMLVTAIVLVAAGVAGVGFIFAAVNVRRDDDDDDEHDGRHGRPQRR